MRLPREGAIALAPDDSDCSRGDIVGKSPAVPQPASGKLTA
jgi:hypothetical protein